MDYKSVISIIEYGMDYVYLPGKEHYSTRSRVKVMGKERGMNEMAIAEPFFFM
jgi:hypothetical protein